MEIRNSTDYTYEIFSEFNRLHMRKLRMMFIVLSSVAVGIQLVQLLLNLFLYRTGRVEAMELKPLYVIIPTLIFVVLILILPAMLARRTCRKQASAHIVSEYVFTVTSFTASTTTDTLKDARECKYEGIVKVTEGPLAFYLYSTSASAYVVAKSGFTQGTEEDLRRLLHTVIDYKKISIK